MVDMLGDVRCPRWFLAAAILATGLTASLEAHAQFFWDQQYQYKRSRPQSGGFFRNFFEPFSSHPREDDNYGPPPRRQLQQQQQHAQPTESSRAPSPRKAESQATPTTSIVVMGDDMADWLAYGLEDVFADSPEIGIVRKNKLNSGLIRYDGKGDLDWWHAARDVLSKSRRRNQPSRTIQSKLKVRRKPPRRNGSEKLALLNSEATTGQRSIQDASMRR
jgi:hypothetical protein